MIELELLDQNNEKYLLQIKTDDMPTGFVEDVAFTIDMARYGDENNLKGHCYAIKCNDQYVGIILMGEAIEDENDPQELREKLYYRIIGFVIDKEYRRSGIGTVALEKVIKNVFSEFGKAPVLLMCHKENINALNFYAKMGFVNTGVLYKQDCYLIR